MNLEKIVNDLVTENCEFVNEIDTKEEWYMRNSQNCMDKMENRRTGWIRKDKQRQKNRTEQVSYMNHAYKQICTQLSTCQNKEPLGDSSTLDVTLLGRSFFVYCFQLILWLTTK